MNPGRTNDNLDDALERNEAQMLAHVARTQGVKQAHRISLARSREGFMLCLAVTVLTIVGLVWLTDLGLWIKLSISACAAAPVMAWPLFKMRRSRRQDEARERQMREHAMSRTGKDSASAGTT